MYSSRTPALPRQWIRGKMMMNERDPSPLPNVVLVENAPELRSLLAAALKEMGYDVTVADNCRGALRGALETLAHVEFALIDQANCGALDFQLLSEQPRLPVIVMSASRDLVAKEIPRVYHLRKPFSRQMLQHVIHDATAHRVDA
jgi:DNA-binding NtrC family response regulator